MDVPRQHALRKGRHSQAGMWYSVTSCVAQRRPLLISNIACPGRDAGPAALVVECLRWLHHQQRWHCKGYVVMPDHVHVVFSLGEGDTLSEVMASFGKFTARRLNGMLGLSGRFWQPGYYDHCLRDEAALERHLRYVAENPVRRGWVSQPEEWPFTAIYPQWDE